MDRLGDSPRKISGSRGRCREEGGLLTPSKVVRRTGFEKRASRE